MLVLGSADVRALLPMRTCMDLVAGVLGSLTRGFALNPLRTALGLPEHEGLLGLMPASLSAPAVFGLKALSVFPGNHGTRFDSHQGLVLLFEPEHGRPLAALDASSITAIRTAAASGVATELLARHNAGDLALLGTGVQARTHLEAMSLARPLRRVRVFGRDAGRRAAFAASLGSQHGLEIEAVDSARAAVDGADILCTVTSSREPVLLGSWLQPGMHVNAVGACTATSRELDAEAVRRSRLFVDRRESALAEAGDFLLARAEGLVGDEHVLGELGELVLGRIAGRRSENDITLFESLGIAVEDLAAAHHVFLRAREEGRGTEVEFGGIDGSA